MKINKQFKKVLCSISAAAILGTSVMGYAMPTYQFDNGMSKGIYYYNAGMYKEAKDELQWFADCNWGDLNSGQQKYLLNYLDSAKSKTKEANIAANTLQQWQFDDGMAKGISYFNKSMYKEAADEFQWFCDANWDKMNAGQREYALDYLDGAKAKFKEYVTVYKYADGYVNSCDIHKNRISEYAKMGWSTSYPATKYEANYTALTNMATAYWKNWLYYPNDATVYDSYVFDTWDDWDAGIVYAKVWINARVRVRGGWFANHYYTVTVSFNKYTGKYSNEGVTEY